MRRREYVRAIGGATSVTILGGLAGCSDSGGGAPAAPFSASIDGPYSYKFNPGRISIYGRLTLTNPPNEWPEEEYVTWVGKNENNRTPFSVIYKRRELPRYQPKKTDFGEDGSVTVNAVLDTKSEIEAGTTYTFWVSKTQEGELFKLAELTYNGNAESRPVQEPPAWFDEH